MGKAEDMAVEECKYGAGIQNSMEAIFDISELLILSGNGGVLDQERWNSMELHKSVDYAIFYFAKILFFIKFVNFTR